MKVTVRKSNNRDRVTQHTNSSFKKRRRVSAASNSNKTESVQVISDNDLRTLLTGGKDEEPAPKKMARTEQPETENLEELDTPNSPVKNDLRNLLSNKNDSQAILDSQGASHNDAFDSNDLNEPVEQVQELINNRNFSEHGKERGPSESVPFSSWSHQLSEIHANKIKVTVILENANLETVRHNGRSGGVTILNCDDHRHLLLKTKRDPNDARPDIIHQCLLALQDSPLNKAGKLKIYIRTARNVLIDVHPRTRIPRTIKRFSGLMAELLEKLKVRGTNGPAPLLKVIRNPVTSHLPVGARKIVCTYNTENVVDIREHASQMAQLTLPTLSQDTQSRPKDDEIEENGEPVNIVYVVGAMAHGKVTEDWADDYICISEYPLSAATVCSRITYAYETMLGIM